MKKKIAVLLCLVSLASVFFGFAPEYIRWVDFNADENILKKVYSCCKQDDSLDFVQLMSYLSLKNGNRFNRAKDEANLKKVIAEIKKNGYNIAEHYKENKYYKYYHDSYTAVFAQFFTRGEDGKLALKAYFPLAKGHWFNHYDDFGNERSFGFKRKHLGHDIMGSVGAKIVAIEGGIIEEMGWNMYGGWRVGVRSHDGKRYWYYAHLRKDTPFAEGLEKGATVEAGQLIGYLGRTGFSTKENTNLKTGKPHLHLGLQLIFDESQKDGNGEIWIDIYGISGLLALNRKSL